MPEHAGTEKITREAGYLYYLEKDGYVWRTPTKENLNGKKQQIGTERIDREEGYLYFVSQDGYVVRSPISTKSTRDSDTNKGGHRFKSDHKPTREEEPYDDWKRKHPELLTPSQGKNYQKWLETHL